ncbi:MAG: alpha/beta hydrolase [Candidatus Zipacnadales bacterium]
MNVIRDIPYRPEYGQYGLLDVWRPDGESPNTPIVVVMHGGGFHALSKERMDNVAHFLVHEGYAAVNINYRLLPVHPFPAPIEDGLAACEWVLTSSHIALTALDRSRLAVLGASAGGYMALAVGMVLGVHRVCGIVDLSGPVRRRDATKDCRLARSPLELASATTPPVLCVHSRNDRLVPPEHSLELAHTLQGLGVQVELFLFDGVGEQHGIWREEAASPRLLPHIEQTIGTFLKKVFG